MATIHQERRVLVEITAPQPKISGHIRRSYFDVLHSLVGPSPYSSRTGGLSKTEHVLPRQSCVRRQQVAKRENHDEDLQGHQISLSQQELVQLISSLILLEEEKKRMPLCSDLKLLQVDLQLKKARVYRAIPYSRLGSNRDAHCYRKAYPHLLAFKGACQEGGRLLLQSEQWEVALEYSLMAWRYTSKLPQWDTASHNAVREQCYSALAAHCATSLRHQPPRANKAQELLRRFKAAQTQSQLISPCVQELERILEESMTQVGDTALMNSQLAPTDYNQPPLLVCESSIGHAVSGCISTGTVS
ncbi:hypothetical protein AAFF_G00210670 [Aldrovandia affinis]|uniref:Uncharacterized protein n=1 Tax=Aldrovandia affinis TaxID=143900 RepID=A0AAD7SWH7_9TELE|nr:hypothetical protein AAFF_G00210670 [Aldrovandia affinis]